MNAKCECEHDKHFGGGIFHVYGKKLEGVEKVKTPYGSFNVCPVCRDTCLIKYKTNPIQHSAMKAAEARHYARNPRKKGEASSHRKPTQDDMNPAARGLKMLTMSIDDLQHIVNEHATFHPTFARDVIIAAAKQMIAAKRRMGAKTNPSALSKKHIHLQEKRDGAWITIAMFPLNCEALARQVFKRVHHRKPNAQLRLFK